jgi:hypothetical protein
MTSVRGGQSGWSRWPPSPSVGTSANHSGRHAERRKLPGGAPITSMALSGSSAVTLRRTPRSRTATTSSRRSSNTSPSNSKRTARPALHEVLPGLSRASRRAAQSTPLSPPARRTRWFRKRRGAAHAAAAVSRCSGDRAHAADQAVFHPPRTARSATSGRIVDVPTSWRSQRAG